MAPPVAQPAPPTYKPYENTSLDTPLFHLLFEPILPDFRCLLSPIYGLRWMLSRPLEIRIFPKWFPVIAVPVIRDAPYLTIGELLLTLPMAILFLASYDATFVSPALEQSGTFASYAIYAAFLTANKCNSIFSFLLGISFERMIPFHLLASLLAVVLGVFHSYVAYVYGDRESGDGMGERRSLSGGDSPYSLVGSTPNLLNFLFDGWNNFSGTLLVISLTGLVLLSIFPFIRRNVFDAWLWSHIALAMGVVAFSYIHEVTSIVFFAGWWGVDLMVRYVVMAGAKYRTKATIKKLSCGDVVAVSFPKMFAYNPGQFVQICIPELTAFQFHPISISSAPHEEKTTLHIRALGGWTKQLLKVAEKLDEVAIYVEGPYGSLSVDLDDDKRYSMVLLVSGGIGVTHTQSVGKAVEYQHFVRGRKLKKLRFVWAVRDMDMVDAIRPLGGDPHGRALVKLRNARRSTVTVTKSPSFDEENPSDASYSDGAEEEGVIETGPKSVVQIDVHCTKGVDNSYETAEYNLINKRPDIDEILREMKAEAKALGESNIAVFGCGPSKLIDSLRDACRKHSSSAAGCGEGVFFDLHTEIFEF